MTVTQMYQLVNDVREQVFEQNSEKSIYVKETTDPWGRFKQLYTNWVSRNGSMIANQIYALVQKYNPIENYNSLETHSGSDTETQTPTDWKETSTQTPTNWTETTTQTPTNWQETETQTPTNWQETSTKTFTDRKDTETQTPTNWTETETQTGTYQTTPQIPNNMEELYQHLIEKKFKDMELRLDNMVKSLIEKNKNITDTNTPLDEGGEGEKNDSNTDVPVSE